MSPRWALPGATQVVEGVRYDDVRYYRRPGHRPVLVIHTPEDPERDRAEDAAHRYPPHLWYEPDSRELRQTMDLAGPALALLGAPAGHETNHRGPCIQVEVEGYAARTQDWPDEWLRRIAEDVVVPVHRIVAVSMLPKSAGVGLLDGETLPTKGVDDAYGSWSSTRLSAAEWYGFHGIVGHQHVPWNHHWDPGRLDLDRILGYAREIVADSTTGVIAMFSFGRTTDEAVYVDDRQVIVRRGNGFYRKAPPGGGRATDTVAFGRETDEALAGRWRDGDSTAYAAVRRGRQVYVSHTWSGNAAARTLDLPDEAPDRATVETVRWGDRDAIAVRWGGNIVAILDAS